jgi:hypothetical protein
MAENPLFELADRFKSLREERDALKNQRTAANKALDKGERELADAMAEAECPNFSRSGKLFVITTTPRWSAEAERKQELYDALRSGGYEHLFTVNPQTLGSFIREQVEETADENGETHVPEWLDGLVSNYDDIGITMRKASKKSN